MNSDPTAFSSNAVTITTGGVPVITRFGLDFVLLPEKSQNKNMMLKHASAASFNLFLRSAGILEDRGTNGGGFELFLGGYAKCMATCAGDPRPRGSRPKESRNKEVGSVGSVV